MPRPLLPLLALLAAGTADARTSDSYKWRQIQQLAQTADLIVVADITASKPEQLAKARADGTMPESIPAELTLHITKVVLGDKSLANHDLVVHEEQDLSSGDKRSKLVFIRDNGNHAYEIPYNGMYGVLPIEQAKIDLWIEGKDHDGRYTVDDVVARALTAHEVDMSVTSTIKPVKSKLAVDITVDNIGSRAADVLPPSYLFNSLRSFRLRNGQYNVSDDWGSVDHWDFVSTDEPTVHLDPGASHTFHYDVPFTQLLIKEAGTYRIDFEYSPKQLSTHAEHAKPDFTKAWLGAARQTSITLDIPKSAL